MIRDRSYVPVATEPPESSTRRGGDSEDDADDDATDAEPEADPTRGIVEPREEDETAEEDETDPSAARFTLPEPSTFVPPTAFVPRRFSETAAAADPGADPDDARTDRVPEEETPESSDLPTLSEDPVKSLVDGILKKVARTDPGESGADAKKTRDPPKKKKSVAWTRRQAREPPLFRDTSHR